MPCLSRAMTSKYVCTATHLALGFTKVLLRIREWHQCMILFQEMKLGGEVSLSLLFIYLFIYIFLFHLLFGILLLLAKADEATRANVIMGDVSDTLEILLAAGGDDYKMLTEEEQKDNDVSKLSYTEEDKTVISHCKGAADPARRLCMFLQDKRNAFDYSTLELQLCL